MNEDDPSSKASGSGADSVLVSKPQSHQPGVGATVEDPNHLTQQEKKEKERFLMFTRVLMK